ncbi:MAG TPA: phage tail protein, partial [Pyrinomonadaceae bacterium]|nr:phage tail protein [Pyrinomonadaceae bacterium]
GLSRENFQIVQEQRIRGRIIDLDLDRGGVFHALVRRKRKVRICRYPTPFESTNKCLRLRTWREPAALAVGPSGSLYVLDTMLGRFIRYDPASGEELHVGEPSEQLLKGFVPSAMEIDERGVIFLAGRPKPSKPGAREPVSLHLFDGDGSYLGKVTRDEKSGEIISREGAPLPEEVRWILGIGFDREGRVYLGTDRGVAKFSLAVTPVGQDGVYYSKTLDNGSPEGLWHRIALSGRLPDKTSVEVSYYASDSTSLKASYEEVLASRKSVEEKEQAIKRLLEPPKPRHPLWKGPNVFKGMAGRDEASPDMLTVENKGRFLWLKIRLVTFDERSRPSVRAARIYYPRFSYLRYLPPAYAEDPSSAAFLERFLALFETIFEGLDREIDQLHRHFDPGVAPAGFLRWLASWINLSLDDELPEERVRRLIRRAPDLYGRKGTPAALTEFLEIYTGGRVSLTEHSRGLKPLVLGGEGLRLGRGTILLGSGVKGFRLGDTSVAGYSALRDRVRDPDEPFLPVARRFSILLDMSREEFDRRAPSLRRILDEQKPAHTACTIGIMADRNAAGSGVLGVSASVVGTTPYQVGVTPLGGGYAVGAGAKAPRVERGAWVGSPGGL